MGQVGRRMTPQRQIILEEIANARDHPTARDLHNRVRARLPRVSLGTVYRNLDLLCEEGKVRRMSTPTGLPDRFEGNPMPHSHVLCVACGEFEDLDFAQPGLERDPRVEKTGYHIVGHQLEFMGYCPRCLAEREETLVPEEAVLATEI